MYRHRLTLIAILVFLALGLWFASRTEVLPLTGAFLGACVGLLAAYVLVHDFRHKRIR
ncbi:MAG: hypothetical protein JWR35_1497 [Marmoricola sp.]|jgi:membrane associated rhomboid family serine protease|nr:hypothetical protein [Marmoricola sp.]